MNLFSRSLCVLINLTMKITSTVHGFKMREVVNFEMNT